MVLQPFFGPTKRPTPADWQGRFSDEEGELKGERGARQYGAWTRHSSPRCSDFSARVYAEFPGQRGCIMWLKPLGWATGQRIHDTGLCMMPKGPIEDMIGKAPVRLCMSLATIATLRVLVEGASINFGPCSEDNEAPPRRCRWNIPRKDSPISVSVSFPSFFSFFGLPRWLTRPRPMSHDVPWTLECAFNFSHEWPPQGHPCCYQSGWRPFSCSFLLFYLFIIPHQRRRNPLQPLQFPREGSADESAQPGCRRATPMLQSH